MTHLTPQAFEFNELTEGFRESGRVFNSTGDRIAVYGRTVAGAYTYAVYGWDLFEQDNLGGGFWSCCDLGGLYSDASSAQQEAQRIVALPGQ